MVREKNKFRLLDPTHFRYIINNVYMRFGGRSSMVEMQVHHESILAYNDKAHAHDHYSFFRSLMKDAYEKTLDELLSRSIDFLESARGVPVLLSLLILSFANGITESGNLPSDRLSLYMSAIDTVLRRHSEVEPQKAEISARALRRIAVANQQAQRRVFTSAEVEEILTSQGEDGELGVWKELPDKTGELPLIKLLEVGGADEVSRYQFRHLSLRNLKG